MTTYVGFEIEVEEDDLFNSRDSSLVFSNSNIKLLTENTKYITSLSNSNIERYHERKIDSSYGKWRLERDSSLMNGAEFISPPLPINRALADLKEFFPHIDSSMCKTSERCGLHINMSSDNMTLKGISISEILSKLDYNFLFSLWRKRLTRNQYVSSFEKILKRNAVQIINTYYNSKKNEKIRTKVDKIANLLLNNRYNFVNIRTAFFNGPSIFSTITSMEYKTYLEIRIAGGENYHRKFKEIEKTVRHFEKALIEAKTKNTEKSKRFIMSYVNRAINENYKAGGNIPIPGNNSRLPFSVLCDWLKPLKNVHNYSKQDLVDFIRKSKVVFLSYSRNYDDVEVIGYYFQRCLSYIHNQCVKEASIKVDTLTNYVLYHYLKYIYHAFGQEKCINLMKSNRPFIGQDLLCGCQSYKHPVRVPKNEPKSEILWFINCITKMDKTKRKEAITKLDSNIIDFLLKRRKRGLILLAREEKKRRITK